MKELILMIIYDNGEPKAKTEMFVPDNFKQLYTIKNNFKKRKDIKFIMYKIYQKIEESEEIGQWHKNN